MKQQTIGVQRINYLLSGKQILLAGLLLLCVLPVCAQDTIPGFAKGFIHKLAVEFRPEYVFPTHRFITGNEKGMSTHLKYMFQFRPESEAGRLFGTAYQGAGLGFFHVGNDKELGTPVSLYLFQGAPITRLNPRLTLDYDWEFGVSLGWNPYHKATNPQNVIIGSSVNFYINVGVYFTWELSRYFDGSLGATATHFSNGNTHFPNAGLNTTGLRLGLAYNFNRIPQNGGTGSGNLLPPFPRHISYDLTLFGAWRRTGVDVGDKRFAAPHTYGVAGFMFAPMYNFNYRLRAGLSLDGTYDAGTGLIAEDSGEEGQDSDDSFALHAPPVAKQLSLGVSARAEYTMPYFTVGLGMGRNLIAHAEKQSWYQLLYLKVDLLRSTYLHLGYRLQEFRHPNHLILGIGYRFHNKYPKIRRK
ncbi:MAG: acyloxyacyl hydrolase [Prevotellaceae bacterium]|jgi:hypothetical protein|nr:acyloxyacyl hydrolase [Prevotellaceae bacterium]